MLYQLEIRLDMDKEFELLLVEIVNAPHLCFFLANCCLDRESLFFFFFFFFSKTACFESSVSIFIF